MQSSKLLEENVFAQIIRDNIENVMGFNKYLQLKQASEKLQQEWAVQRLNAQKEIEEYEGLCKKKVDMENELITISESLDAHYKYTVSMRDSYEKAKNGIDTLNHTNNKVQKLEASIQDIYKKTSDYTDDIKLFIDNLEMNVFLPKLARSISPEIQSIDTNQNNYNTVPMIEGKEEVYYPPTYCNGHFGYVQQGYLHITIHLTTILIMFLISVYGLGYEKVDNVYNGVCIFLFFVVIGIYGCVKKYVKWVYPL